MEAFLNVDDYKERRLKELEEENFKLRSVIKVLNNKLSSAHKKLNKINDDIYNDVTPERDDR